MGAVTAHPAAPAAGRTAQTGDAVAAGGAPSDHAPSAGPGWAQARRSRQRRGHADSTLRFGGQPQYPPALSGPGRLVPNGCRRCGARQSSRPAMLVDAVHSSGTCGNWLRPRERDKWLELARGWLLAFGPNPSPSSCFDPSESQYWPEPASPEETVGSEISGACALLRPPCPLRPPLRQGSGHRPARLDARPRLAWERHGSPGPVGAAPCRPPWPVRCC